MNIVRRLLLISLVSSVAVLAPSSPASSCTPGARVATVNEAHATLGDVKVAMWETTPYDACASGVAEGEVFRRLLVTRGGEVLCDRRDVDPSFDPFLFGAGLRTVDPGDDCGVHVSMSSINNPILPDTVGLFPPSISASTRRTTPAEGHVWYTVGGVKVVGEPAVDPNAYSVRGVSVRSL
ncbi:MAG TPA: hypothetical protein VM840_03055 [Actinomycetota bacterium]|nr:hypothetical protein [Actinomycetota bacterium]